MFSNRYATFHDWLHHDWSTIVVWLWWWDVGGYMLILMILIYGVGAMWDTWPSEFHSSQKQIWSKTIYIGSERCPIESIRHTFYYIFCAVDVTMILSRSTVKSHIYHSRFHLSFTLTYDTWRHPLVHSIKICVACVICNNDRAEERIQPGHMFNTLRIYSSNLIHILAHTFILCCDFACVKQQPAYNVYFTITCCRILSI